MNEFPGYSNPQRYCDWCNATTMRNDVKWIVGPAGTPILVDREDWSEAHARAEHDRQETERKRFNWRLLHPVSEN